MDDFYDRFADLRRRGVPIVLVTAVAKEGAGPVDVGKKMAVTLTRGSFGTVGGGAIEHYAIKKACELLKTRGNLLESYYLKEGEVAIDAKSLPMACGGKVTLFYEYSGPKEHVFLFGAGHVALALSRVLKTLDFFIEVIDDRKEVLDGFLYADAKHNVPFVDFVSQGHIGQDAMIVVATPSHKDDYHVLNKIIELKIEPKYFGMLCSPEKLKDYLQKTKDIHPGPIDLSHFYSPIGLDTGGNTPEEIAISIASEMLAIANDKKGHRHMREVHYGQDPYWKN
ncbi:MAG: XdhC/CoxI family protein [Candidatus Izemoplasmatales bacterium]|jgi:xanthine dehydrogenase accessory factor|nr:XdhC/CoxI family protein [Candidatus Izemoplasmatales bacterium]